MGRLRLHFIHSGDCGGLRDCNSCRLGGRLLEGLFGLDHHNFWRLCHRRSLLNHSRCGLRDDCMRIANRVRFRFGPLVRGRVWR